MAPGASPRRWRLIVVVVSIAVAVAVIVWSVVTLSPSSSPRSTADTWVLFERTLPSEILTEGNGYQNSSWQWPIFDYHPCTNATVPAVNCTSLNATLTPGGYYDFSFEVNNQADFPAEIADLETNVNFSYSSVPSQYCNGGGAPEFPGPTVGAHSSMSITMNLTLPTTPGTYNPDLTLVVVIGGCSEGNCAWGC